MSINLEKRISPDKKGITLAFILSILWSGNPISIKAGLEDAPPLRLGWMRFVLGGIVAILWSLYNKETVKFKKSDVIPLIGTGLLFSVQLGFMNIGQNYTSGGHGVIMITTFPLWASLFSHLFIPHDKLPRFKMFGMIKKLILQPQLIMRKKIAYSPQQISHFYMNRVQNFKIK